MAKRKYTIDFFLVDIRDQQQQRVSLSHILEQMKQGQINMSTHYLEYQRDIWDIYCSPTTGRYSAQLRKLRRTDLPEIGAIGSQSQPITLGENQGVIEKNCFVFDPSTNVLAWHNNLHAATPKILGEVLSLLCQKNIGIYPILKIDAIHRLLQNNHLIIKELDIAFAKPTNPIAFNTNEPISGKLLSLLDQSGADKLDLRLSMDSRMKDSQGGLSQWIKNSINALMELNPRRAKLNIRDEIESRDFPIDLIADRVRSYQNVSIPDNITTLPSTLLFEAIDKAFTEVNSELNEIIGSIPPSNPT
ncbi:DUF6731 family protein [Mannheimia haemolytica]